MITLARQRQRKTELNRKHLTYSYKDKLAIIREIDTCQSQRIIRRIIADHNLSTEELAEWRQKIEDDGLEALKATKRFA